MPGPLAKALIEGLGLKAGNNPFSGMGLATAGLSTDHNFFNLKMPNPFKKDATKESGYSYNVSPLCKCAEVVEVICTFTYPGGISENKNAADHGAWSTAPWPVSGFIRAPYGKPASPDNLKNGNYGLSCKARFRNTVTNHEAEVVCPTTGFSVK